MTEPTETANTVNTLTKAEMVAHLMDTLGLSKQQGRMIVDAFFAEMVETLVAGRDIKLSGFGNFTLRDKPARPGRNPKTGDEVTIAPRRVVTFKAGNKLREQINIP